VIVTKGLFFSSRLYHSLETESRTCWRSFPLPSLLSGPETDQCARSRSQGRGEKFCPPCAEHFPPLSLTFRIRSKPDGPFFPLSLPLKSLSGSKATQFAAGSILCRFWSGRSPPSFFPKLTTVIYYIFILIRCFFPFFPLPSAYGSSTTTCVVPLADAGPLRVDRSAAYRVFPLSFFLAQAKGGGPGPVALPPPFFLFLCKGVETISSALPLTARARLPAPVSSPGMFSLPAPTIYGKSGASAAPSASSSPLVTIRTGRKFHWADC